MENEEIEKKETNVVKVETMQENPDNTDSDEGFAPSENKNVDEANLISRCSIWIKDACPKFVFWIKNNKLAIWIKNIFKRKVNNEDPEYKKSLDIINANTDRLKQLDCEQEQNKTEIVKLEKLITQYETSIKEIEEGKSEEDKKAVEKKYK